MQVQGKEEQCEIEQIKDGVVLSLNLQEQFKIWLSKGEGRRHYKNEHMCVCLCERGKC